MDKYESDFILIASHKIINNILKFKAEIIIITYSFIVNLKGEGIIWFFPGKYLLIRLKTY